MYSCGHPGSFNPAVITNKETHMINENTNNKTGFSQAAGWLSQENKSKISGPSACCVGQM